MLIVAAIVVVRLLVPLAILRFPLPAILVALVVDAADQSILQQTTDLSLDSYQSFDKALDIYYLSIAYLAVHRNWTDAFAIRVAAFLWYYRLVGVLLFELTEGRWLLFVFPNTFEYFFIAYSVIQTRWDPRRLSHRAVVGIAACVWVFVKLPQEWWIHIAQNDFTDFMHETVFGVEVTAPWSEAVRNRPAVTAALVVAIAAVVVVLRWVGRRLPAPDWSFRFDMDRTDPQVRRTVPGFVSARAAVVEKLALVGLIAAIFANVLGVGASALQILGATAVLVGVDIALSSWLARRGHEWTSHAVEFVAVAATNAVLLGAYALVVSGQRMDRTMTLFFGLLLTIQIVLFDRYRPVVRSTSPAG